MNKANLTGLIIISASLIMLNITLSNNENNYTGLGPLKQEPINKSNVNSSSFKLPTNNDKINAYATIITSMIISFTLATMVMMQ